MCVLRDAEQAKVMEMWETSSGKGQRTESGPRGQPPSGHVSQIH